MVFGYKKIKKQECTDIFYFTKMIDGVLHHDEDYEKIKDLLDGISIRGGIFADIYYKYDENGSIRMIVCFGYFRKLTKRNILFKIDVYADIIYYIYGLFMMKPKIQKLEKELFRMYKIVENHVKQNDENYKDIIHELNTKIDNFKKAIKLIRENGGFKIHNDDQLIYVDKVGDNDLFYNKFKYHNTEMACRKLIDEYTPKGCRREVGFARIIFDIDFDKYKVMKNKYTKKEYIKFLNDECDSLLKKHNIDYDGNSCRIYMLTLIEKYIYHNMKNIFKSDKKIREQICSN